MNNIGRLIKSNAVCNLKLANIKNINIYPCSKGVQNCLCVNYLDFTNYDHINIYKQCLIYDKKSSKMCLKLKSKYINIL